MSIENKLIYLNGTKEKLKESINNIGGSITDETTFRAYATELDNIYTNLPKTTGEGSNLSLTTLKGRINVDNIKGDTQQDSTPTPSSPQDINVVTGTQEVVVQNKNLFNKDTITENQRIGPSGNKNYDENCDLSDYIKIQPNTTYTRNITASVYECIAFYTSEKVFISRDTAHSTTTSPNNAYYVRLSCYKTNLDTLQFELGSTATSYIAHQEQTKTLHLGDIELCKIGTYQDRIYKNSDKWYIEKNIGKVVLKDVPQGANNWTKSNAYSTNDYFCGFCGFASIKINSYYILCNKLINAIYSDTTTSECIANDSESVNLKIKASRLSENSPTGLANYLANEGSDIYIQYILKTPTYEEITNETLIEELNELEKMMSYNGQTNISVSGNLPMILDVTALKGE